MIPQKLYIPTSSQNFNNIMSSESISPATFYERRNFGMRRFVRVTPNNLDDRITLYDGIPDFTIPVSDEDNFPIYIEVQTACYDENMFYASEQDGVYYCDRTIYISPFHCKFLFRSEGEYRIIYSSQQRSLNTKMTRLYAKAFYPITQNYPRKEYNYASLTNSGKDFSVHIAFDRRVNKLKGFYLAYLIGKMKDLSPSFVHMYHLTMQISDTLASTLTSQYPTLNQSLQTDNLTDELNKVLRSISKEEEYIAEALKKDKSIHNIEGDLIGYLRSHLWFDNWKLQMKIPVTYQIHPFFAASFKSDSEQDAKDQYVDDIYAHLDALRGHTYPISAELPLIKQQQVASIPESGFLEFALIEALQEVYNGKDFIEDRYQFSLSICKQYKNTVGEDEFAFARQYLNALNKNLNNHEAFEINSIGNEGMKAYAAFCQKGDPDDFNKLEEHMIKAELGNLHQGFALAGMVFGYADMPKTFTNNYTHADNYDFIKQTYKYLTQIAGIDLSYIKEDIEIADKVLSSPTIPSFHKKICDVIKPLNPTQKTLEKINEAVEIESRQYSPLAFMEILNNFIKKNTAIYKAYKEYFATNQLSYTSYEDFRSDVRKIYNKHTNSKTKVLWSDIEKALELEAKIGNPTAFMMILDDHLNPHSAEYKALEKYLGTRINSKIKSNNYQEPTLFSTESQDGGLWDSNANLQKRRTSTPKFSHQKSITPLFKQQTLHFATQTDPKSIFHSLDWIEKIEKKIPYNDSKNYIKNIDWFVINHSDSYKNEKGQTLEGRYFKEATTNQAVIQHLEIYLKTLKFRRISENSISIICDYLKKEFL